MMPVTLALILVLTSWWDPKEPRSRVSRQGLAPGWKIDPAIPGSAQARSAVTNQEQPWCVVTKLRRRKLLLSAIRSSWDKTPGLTSWLVQRGLPSREFAVVTLPG